MGLHENKKLLHNKRNGLLIEEAAHRKGEKFFQQVNRQKMNRKYRKFKKLRNPKINDPMKKWAKELKRDFSKEEVQMAKTHMKKCSASLAIKEKKIKIILRFHLTPVNGDHQEWKQQQMLARMWGKGTLIYCWWRCKLVQPLWKTVWRAPQKAKNIPAI
jgi:hypothetical protein